MWELYIIYIWELYIIYIFEVTVFISYVNLYTEKWTLNNKKFIVNNRNIGPYLMQHKQLSIMDHASDPACSNCNRFYIPTRDDLITFIIF